MLNFSETMHFLPDVDFGYSGQKPLFKKVNFGIDMETRSKYNNIQSYVLL